MPNHHVCFQLRLVELLRDRRTVNGLPEIFRTATPCGLYAFAKGGDPTAKRWCACPPCGTRSTWLLQRVSTSGSLALTEMIARRISNHPKFHLNSRVRLMNNKFESLNFILITKSLLSSKEHPRKHIKPLKSTKIK